LKWEEDGNEWDMSLISGFAGATITDDGFIQPVLGWAVAVAAADGSPCYMETEPDEY